LVKFIGMELLTDQHKKELFELYDHVNNTTTKHQWYGREVGGYFTIEDEKLKTLVVLGTGAGKGQQEAFTHPCCRDYVFHTHPKDLLFDDVPPSGADLVGTLAWGGPINYKENMDGKLHTKMEYLVTQAGIYAYNKTPELKAFYDSLLPEKQELESESESESSFSESQIYQQENYFELLEWYIVYAIGLFGNKKISRNVFMETIRTIDMQRMVRFARSNPEFRKYIEDSLSNDKDQIMTLDEVELVIAQTPSFLEKRPGFIIEFLPRE